MELKFHTSTLQTTINNNDGVITKPIDYISISEGEELFTPKPYYVDGNKTVCMGLSITEDYDYVYVHRVINGKPCKPIIVPVDVKHSETVTDLDILVDVIMYLTKSSSTMVDYADLITLLLNILDLVKGFHTVTMPLVDFVSRLQQKVVNVKLQSDTIE